MPPRMNGQTGNRAGQVNTVATRGPVGVTHQVTTVPVVSERPALREYLVRYAVVDRVDNQDEECTHCMAVVGGNVECNVYVTTWTGDAATAETCHLCALKVVDEHLDTDPAYVVVIERANR